MRIHTLDLGFQGLPEAVAAYLVECPNGPVLIETGPTSTWDALVAGLARHGHTVDDVRHVLVTHIHLDHAGAAGRWAQRGARVYVHHIGAPHLIDPSKLLASATRIYGDRMERLWGEVVPAPAERVTALRDGDRIEIAGTTFAALDTPGHARHHMVYRCGDVAFTGDVAAIKLPGSRFVDIPAPPPEFDLDAWLATLSRLEREGLATFFLTHFGRVDDVPAHLALLRALLVDTAEFVRQGLVAGLVLERRTAAYLERHERRAIELGADSALLRRYIVANPPIMSVTGISRYWSTRPGLHSGATPP